MFSIQANIAMWCWIAEFINAFIHRLNGNRVPITTTSWIKWGALKACTLCDLSGSNSTGYAKLSGPEVFFQWVETRGVFLCRPSHIFNKNLGLKLQCFLTGAIWPYKHNSVLKSARWVSPNRSLLCLNILNNVSLFLSVRTFLAMATSPQQCPMGST